MIKFLVSGLINIETTLKIEGFPLNYNPVNYPFYGVHSNVSGVGYNVAKALTVLGASVDFLSIIGDDDNGMIVDANLKQDKINSKYMQKLLRETCQSVIIYENSGRRQIHVDLKELQETPYPEDLYKKAVAENEVCLLCNINFSRSMLAEAKKVGKLIATDVHALSSLDDEYNRDFLEAADILFLSDEHLPESPEDFSLRIMERFPTKIVVIGLGAKGALLTERKIGSSTLIPAVQTREVVNTIGAGDSLFSAFIFSYMNTKDALLSLKKAVCFASYKIGEKGAAAGFLTAKELARLYADTM